MKGNATTEGYEAMQAFLAKFENAGKITIHSVDIGVIESKRYPPKGDGEDGTERTPPTIAQVALWNEFGTRGGRSGGGWGGPVPARPFMRKGMEKAPKDREVKDEMKHGGLHGIDERVGERLGLHYKRLITNAMRDKGMAPNAPLTIRLKKSSVPLVDKGFLKSAIDFRVNKDDPGDTGGGFAL